MSDVSAAGALRLLIVNYEFPPIGGGASYASHGLARTLAARGHHVDVLTSRIAGQPAVEDLDGLRVHRVTSWRHGLHDCGIRGAATFLLFARQRLASLLRTQRYDLVHYFFGLPTGLLANYTHGRHGIPYIVSLRGSDVPGYDPTDRTLNTLHQLLGGVTRGIWRNARAVVANSTALRDLASAFEPGIAIEVVPNAVVDAPLAPARSAVANGPVQVLCVARLIERKGVGTLLAAAAALADLNWRLHIVGGGRDEPCLHAAAAASAELADKVIFHGSLPHEEVLRRCAAADVFVLPTLSESCSMALLEAMSCGLPAIATRVGGNPSLVRHGENGLLVPPGDIAALTDALRMLVQNGAKRAAMSQASLDLVAAQFTWGVNADRYEAVYRRALSTA